MLYHLIAPEDWKLVEDQEEYRPESLRTEGFIHLSTKTQLDKTYELIFQGQEMLVLEVDETKLIEKLIYENVPDQNEAYPHLYGPLNRQAIVRVRKY